MCNRFHSHSLTTQLTHSVSDWVGEWITESVNVTMSMTMTRLSQSNSNSNSKLEVEYHSNHQWSTQLIINRSTDQSRRWDDDWGSRCDWLWLIVIVNHYQSMSSHSVIDSESDCDPDQRIAVSHSFTASRVAKWACWCLPISPSAMFNTINPDSFNFEFPSV